ncbi:MAG: protein tyrosine phosphatase family protein [Pseudomonadota bacterium]
MRNGWRTSLLVAMLLAAPAQADDDVVNYIAYDETFSSGGGVTASALERLRDAGLERVIFLAYSDQEQSLENEDRVVDELGMDFVHIPVRWDAPDANHFGLFAAIMQQAPERPTLVHCQANFRASAFAMLYRVIYNGVPLAEAKADMNAVWTPTETWTDFILETLERNGVDPNCEGCDWTPYVPED